MHLPVLSSAFVLKKLKAMICIKVNELKTEHSVTNNPNNSYDIWDLV